MYHIIVTIYGRSQLRRIDKEKITLLERELDLISGKLGAIEHNNELSYRLYSMPSGYNESSYAALEIAINLNKNLSDASNMLYGYNIILLKSESEYFDEWKKYLYLPTVDNKIWIQSNIKDDFNEWVTSEDIGLISFVSSIKEQIEDSGALKERFLYQESLEPLFYKAVSGSKNRTTNFLNFYGAVGIGKHYSLKKVLSSYTKGQPDITPLWLSPGEGRYGELEGLKTALDPNLLIKMVEKADEADHAIIARLKYLINAIRYQAKESFIADHLARDMQILYSLYLKYYKRLFTTMDLVPVVIIEEIDRFAPHAQTLLLAILERCHKEAILIIYLGNTRLESHDKHAFYLEATADHAIKSAIAENIIPDPQRLTRAKPYALMLYYWQHRNSNEEFYGEFSINGVLRWFVKQIDLFSLKALYIVAICDGMSPFELMLDHLTENGLERISFLQRLKSFINLGLINNPAYPVLVFSDLALILKEQLGDEAILIYKNVALSLYKTSQSGGYINLRFLFILLERADFVDEALTVLHRLFQQELNARNGNLNSLFDRHYFSKGLLSFDQRSKLDIILYSAKLRKKMLESLHGSDLLPFIKEAPPSDENSHIYASFMSLEKRRFYNATGHSDYPHYQIKDILYAFQKNQEPYGEALASIEMANTLLINGQLRQAFDYCEINSRLCEQLNFSYGTMLNLSIEIACAFAFGNIALALRDAERGILLAASCVMREKELFFLFAKGRALFECGYNKEALDTFDSAVKLAKLYGKKRYLTLLSSWKARCHSHLKQFDEALALFGGHSSAENLYFLAECYYFMGQMIQAVETIKNGQNYSDEEFFTLSEKESWSNGFDMIEGRVNTFYSKENLLKKLINSFATFLSGIAYDRRRALEQFDQLYDFNKIIADEPFSYLYSFYYSELLDDERDRELKSTTESRSGRLLNTRASRFDELSMQEDFLRKNYWNHCCGRAFRK